MGNYQKRTPRVIGSSKICQLCGSSDSTVVDSRECAVGIRRRRRYDECSNRWSTLEINIGLAQDVIQMVEVAADMQKRVETPHSKSQIVRSKEKWSSRAGLR